MHIFSIYICMPHGINGFGISYCHDMSKGHPYLKSFHFPIFKSLSGRRNLATLTTLEEPNAHPIFEHQINNFEILCTHFFRCLITSFAHLVLDSFCHPCLSSPCQSIYAMNIIPKSSFLHPFGVMSFMSDP